MSNLSASSLGLIKQRLNRLDTNLDEYLATVAASAEKELTRLGLHLQDDEDDRMLLVDYAVWRYQNRDQAGASPAWLRLRIRERWISMKGRT